MWMNPGSTRTQWAGPGKVRVRCLCSRPALSAQTPGGGAWRTPKLARWKEDKSANRCAGPCGPPVLDADRGLGACSRAAGQAALETQVPTLRRRVAGAGPQHQHQPGDGSGQVEGGRGESLWSPRGRMLLTDQLGRPAEAWDTGKGRPAGPLDRDGEGPPTLASRASQTSSTLRAQDRPSPPLLRSPALPQLDGTLTASPCLHARRLPWPFLLNPPPSAGGTRNLTIPEEAPSRWASHCFLTAHPSFLYIHLLPAAPGNIFGCNAELSLPYLCPSHRLHRQAAPKTHPASPHTGPGLAGGGGRRLSKPATVSELDSSPVAQEQCPLRGVWGGLKGLCL